MKCCFETLTAGPLPVYVYTVTTITGEDRKYDYMTSC